MAGKTVVMSVVAIVALIWTPMTLEAQRRGGLRYDERPAAPRFALGIHLMGADAVGEFGQGVGGGFGGQLGARVGLDEQSILGLRLDGGFMVYGHERQALCFPPPIGCRIGTDLSTTNSVAYMGIGPEIAVPGPISPYVFGTFGFSYFTTNSSLSGANDFDESLFNTRNYGDFVTAARLGGGLRFRIADTGGGNPISLDLGAEYHRNGVAEYLREGDILDHPDGSITLFPQRTEANYMTFRVGVQIGLGGGEDRDWDQRDGRGRR